MLQMQAILIKKIFQDVIEILHQELELKMPVVNPIQCVARIASKLGITEKTKRYATKILKVSQERKESAGKDPMGLAAAALYMSCVKNGEDMTQRDIAEAANVTEVTIRNRYKGLRLESRHVTVDIKITRIWHKPTPIITKVITNFLIPVELNLLIELTIQ